MSAELAAKVWFDPWKYWSATANMSKEEADSVFEKAMDYAETGNLDALKRYPFIAFEDPVATWRRRRMKAASARLAS